jgi:hypothetical protein
MYHTDGQKGTSETLASAGNPTLDEQLVQSKKDIHLYI